MSKKVMVIDDSEVALQVIRDDLEDGGYEVTTAHSCEEANQILGKGKRPDVILVDLMMPGMDGGQFCKAVKAAPETQNIPIFIISMKEENEIKVITDQVGADGYIWKSNVSATALDRLIQKL